MGQSPPDPVAGASYDLVPDDLYVVLAERSESGPGWTDRKTGKPKRALYVHCRIVQGPFKGVMLFLPLNLSFVGKFPRPSSEFYQAWSVAMDRKPILGERMGFNVFHGKVFEVKVRTVIRDGFGRVQHGPHLSGMSRSDLAGSPRTEHLNISPNRGRFRLTVMAVHHDRFSEFPPAEDPPSRRPEGLA